MRRTFAGLMLGIALLGAPLAAIAQELPNIPIVAGGWAEKFWTHPDGTKFHYLEMGQGTPVILIHGLGGAASNWMENGLGPALAKTNKVYAIDMRGHGQTVGPDGKRQARTVNMDLDVLAFMDAMKIKKAHIGGYSMGGWVTGHIMARAPGRFITAHFGGSGVPEVEGSVFADLVPPEPEGPAPLEAEALRLYETRQAAQAQKAGVSNDPNDKANLSSQRAMPPMPRPAIDLTKITFPILAVIGEFDQPYARTYRLWREAPFFEKVILKNRGHLSAYMAGVTPELYRDTLVRFITTNNPKP